MKLLYANDTSGEHAPSWYAATATTPNYPALSQTERFDVCIIGGGYTGLSAALTAASRGLSVCVLEAHRIGWGASGRNGGQLGSGFNRHEKLAANFGETASLAYWQMAERAKAYVLTLCEEHDIDVHYQPGIVSTIHRPVPIKTLRSEVDSFNKLHPSAKLVALDKDALQEHIVSDDYFAGIYDPHAGHLHPLKLALGLASVAKKNGATLYERSAVTSIDHNASANDIRFTVSTEHAHIECQQLVCAMNGYLDGLVPKARRDVIPINNFIVATEPLGERIHQLLPSNVAIADSRFVVNYFRRSADDRLLFGGGENYGQQFPPQFPDIVQRAMLTVFPTLQDVQIDYAWGGTLGITRSRWPSVQELEPGLYSSSGYSGHGVALANFCGHAVGKALVGDTDDFHQLSALTTGWIPGNDRIRPLLASLAMGGSSLLDKLPSIYLGKKHD